MHDAGQIVSRRTSYRWARSVMANLSIMIDCIVCARMIGACCPPSAAVHLHLKWPYIRSLLLILSAGLQCGPLVHSFRFTFVLVEQLACTASALVQPLVAD